jgi:predicted PurR-regulated permease PerM
VVALALLCWVAPIVPTILLLSGLLALVLSFPLRPLSRVLPRGRAVGVVVGGAMLLLVLAAAALVPRLLAELPGYVATLTTYQNTVPGLPADGGAADAALSGVVRALAAGSREAVSDILGGVLAAFSGVIGVPYAGLLGAVMWVTAFVPIFGAWLGGIPAFLVALTVSPQAALLTAVAYLTINLLDGNVLTPRLQGGALRLHPIVVLLAVLGAGQALGLLGILFTLPLLAVLRVVGGFFAARLRTRTAPTPLAPSDSTGAEVHAPDSELTR